MNYDIIVKYRSAMQDISQTMLLPNPKFVNVAQENSKIKDHSYKLNQCTLPILIFGFQILAFVCFFDQAYALR